MTRHRRWRVLGPATGLALVVAATAAAASLSSTPQTTARLVDQETVRGSMTAGTWGAPASALVPDTSDALGPEGSTSEFRPHRDASPPSTSQSESQSEGPSKSTPPDQPAEPEPPESAAVTADVELPDDGVASTDVALD